MFRYILNLITGRKVTYLRDKQNQESINILSGRGTVVDVSRITVAESYTDRLIKEDYICVIVP